MSKSQFEKLIEYVINDEEAKARELFHNIVVEKSRSIYESIMEEESIEEAAEEESIEEAVEEESVEEGMDGSLGGDQSDSLIDDVEAEEQGMQEGEEEFAMVDAGMGDDSEGEEGGLEDRVVKLEDELDRLMAEFEEEFGPMGDGNDEGDMDDMDDTPDMTSQEVDNDELETEGMMEAVTLKAAPKPVTSEPAGTNTRSINDNNSGSKGPIGSTVKPVHMTGTEAQGRPAPGTKELIGKVGNSPSQSTQEPKPATKPHLAQASGVNTKSPNLGRKG
jgi:hypothetical protein